MILEAKGNFQRLWSMAGAGSETIAARLKSSGEATSC